MWINSLRGGDTVSTPKNNNNNNIDQAIQQSRRTESLLRSVSKERASTAIRSRRVSIVSTAIDMSKQHPTPEQAAAIFQRNDKEIKSGLSLSLRMTLPAKESCFAHHLDGIQGTNDLYFKHLQGNCKCGKCTCTRCKCPSRGILPDFQRQPKSLYQQDFKQKDHSNTRAAPFPLDKETYVHPGKVEMATTQRNDFIAKVSGDPKKECGHVDRNSIQCGVQAIDHNTVYNNTYNKKRIPSNVLFTHEPIEYLRVPHDKIKQAINSEKRIRFGSPNDRLLPSQTTEDAKRFTFVNFAYDRDKNLKPPISMDDRMSLTTTHQKSYAVAAISSTTPLAKGATVTATPKAAAAAITEAETEQSICRKKRTSSLSDPYNRDFIRLKNTSTSVFNNALFPYHDGQFISSKANSYQGRKFSETCINWGAPQDETRMPKSQYMHAYA